MKQKALTYLYSLGIIDKEIFELKKQEQVLPNQKDELNKELDTIKSEIDNLNKLISEIESTFPELNKRLEEAQAGYNKAESKISSITTNEEYDKIYSERSTFKGMIKSINNEKNRNNEKIDEAKEKIEELQKKLSETEEELLPNIKKLKREINKTSKRIAEKLEEREATLELLRKEDLEIANTYETNYKIKKNGIVVGFVTNSANYCSNCYNAIPLQTVYNIRDGKEVAICENCGVLLVSDNFNKPTEENQKGEEE